MWLEKPCQVDKKGLTYLSINLVQQLDCSDFISEIIKSIHLANLSVSVSFRISLESLLPFTCDETRKQLLIAAPKRQRRNSGSNC